MLTFFKRVFSEEESGSEATLLGRPDEKAPDGNREMLESGIWALKPAIPVEAFPEALVLTEHDVRLTPSGASEVLLASAKAGKHRVELLLTDSDRDTVVLSVRIPTAANQFKDPYVIMEDEHGNSCEDAVREIDFHLRGRVPEDAVRRVEWAEVFRTAAEKLEALRGHT